MFKINNIAAFTTFMLYSGFSLFPLKSSAEYWAPRCSPLTFTFNLDKTEVDVSDLKNNALLAKILQSRNGTCDFRDAKKNSDYGWAYLTLDTQNGGDGYSYDSTKSVYIKPNSTFYKYGLGAKQITYSTSQYTDLNTFPNSEVEIFLNKKTPGSSVINLDDLTLGFTKIHTSGAAGYDWHSALESNAVVNNNARLLTLIYRPSCSAKVNDVPFGVQTVDSIKKGNAEKEALIEVSCEAILPAYSITLNSSKGINDVKKGIIKSAHNNIGYQLSWGKGDGSQVGALGTAVELGEPISPDTKPIKNNFTIPLKVKPVILNNTQGVTSGNADSDITITLEFK